MLCSTVKIQTVVIKNPVLCNINMTIGGKSTQ